MVLASIPPDVSTVYSYSVSSDTDDIIDDATENGSATGANPLITSMVLTGNEGTATVSVTATLNGCTSAVMTYEIVVNDANGLHFVNCPAAPIMKSNDLGECSAVVDWTPPTAIDDCSNSGAITVSHVSNPEKSPGVPYGPGDAFPVGVTVTITYTADDGNGNTASCTFQVMVMRMFYLLSSMLMVSQFLLIQERHVTV